MAQQHDDSNLSSPAATQGARRASAVAAGGANLALPESEVAMKASRRRYPAAFKKRILEQADRCTEPGEIGALLRREGLYSSHLRTWRAQRDRGVVEGLTPRKRGRKAKERSPEAVRVKELQRENERLLAKLEQAELIIDVQKKVSRLLGISMPPQNSNEKTS